MAIIDFTDMTGDTVLGLQCRNFAKKSFSGILHEPVKFTRNFQNEDHSKSKINYNWDNYTAKVDR